MFKQIAEFVENIMSKYLCGFRKGYNTQHALMRLLDKLNKINHNYKTRRDNFYLPNPRTVSLVWKRLDTEQTKYGIQYQMK